MSETQKKHLNLCLIINSSGVYLVAESADRYPADDDGGISDFSIKIRSISHLRSCEGDKMWK